LVGSRLWGTGCDPGAGEAFFFFFFVLPFLGVFGLVHVVAFVVSARAATRTHDFSKLYWTAAILVCWVLAVAFDRFKVLDVVCDGMSR